VVKDIIRTVHIPIGGLCFKSYPMSWSLPILEEIKKDTDTVTDTCSHNYIARKMIWVNQQVVISF